MELSGAEVLKGKEKKITPSAAVEMIQVMNIIAQMKQMLGRQAQGNVVGKKIITIRLEKNGICDPGEHQNVIDPVPEKIRAEETFENLPHTTLPKKYYILGASKNISNIFC